MAGSLFLVATPIGNLEDITLRAIRVLKEADLIAAEDTRHTGRLLSHLGIATPTVSLHAHNEKRRVPELVSRMLSGLRLAVVTDAGMPAISDPGYLIARHAVEAGIDVSVVPGVSALTTALAGSALPSDAFCFLGFAPSRAAERRRWVRANVANHEETVVIFEAPGRVMALLRDLFEELGDRRVVVARELTKVHESWHRGWLADFLTGESKAIPDRGESVILVSAQKRPGADDQAQPTDEEIGAVFGRVSADAALSRRQTVRKAAEILGLSPRLVYAALERQKISVE